MHASWRRDDTMQRTPIPVVGPSGEQVPYVADNAGPNRVWRYLKTVRRSPGLGY